MTEATGVSRPMNEIAAATGRIDGYAPLRDYAAIGDGRTVALVARDASIDWLCLPNLDSPWLFGALLDEANGGSFSLSPSDRFEATRRYLPHTNVLETTFRTQSGSLRVTDAMTLPSSGLCPERELVRVVDGLDGSVEVAWRVQPRFGSGFESTHFGRRSGIPVAWSGNDAIAVCSWDAGDPVVSSQGISGSFMSAPGTRAFISLSGAHQEPLVFPPRADLERRLISTIAFWRSWTLGRSTAGPWQKAMIRSALALKLLVHAPSGAIAAAATTSLPEELGGGRNWDYRFCWVRDSAFTVEALLRLGCTKEADAFFWWLMHASQRTHPRLQVLYRLDGSSRAPEHSLPLDGYRNSQPVRVGNGAAGQVQLDVYGDLLQTAWLYAQSGARLDADFGRRLAGIADFVCEIWSEPDAGIWEVRSEPKHFTQSKIMCWLALDRAERLAGKHLIPDDHIERWRHGSGEIRRFVEEQCWSEAKQSYARVAGSDELDASLLLAVLFGYPAGEKRLEQTVEAVRRELAHGPYIYRYSGDDGLGGKEGFFLTCSFWLVEALALVGRCQEAHALMEELVGLGNDVGLYSEEIDPKTQAFLGNLPQGLCHLALINAAGTLAKGRLH